MTDLVADTPPVVQSPKRKFSFRFPNLSHHNSVEKDTGSSSGTSHNGHHHSGASGSSGSTTALSHAPQKHHNFSDEVNNVADLQVNEHIFFFRILKLLHLHFANNIHMVPNMRLTIITNILQLCVCVCY